MRSTAVKAAIISAVVATTVDTSAHADDRFRHIDAGYRDVTGAHGRIFTLEYIGGGLPAREMLTTDLRIANWELVVYYSDNPGIDERIMLDNERISTSLDSLAGTVADIAAIDINNNEIRPFDGQIRSTFGIDTRYRLDAGV